MKSMENSSKPVHFDAFNSSQSGVDDLYFEKVVPAIVIVGLISGLFSVIVLFRRDMRDMSFAQYLLGNAIANIIYLCCLGVVRMQSAGYGILNYNFVFQIFVWLTYSSNSFATWCAVISGADNCVRLCWPWLIPEYCSTTRSKEVLNALVITIGISYSVGQWTSPEIQLTHERFEEWTGMFFKPHDLLTSVDILMNGIFPMVVSLPTTFRLGIQLSRKAKRNPHHLLRNTMLMLFAVQLVFLLLFLPGCLARLYLVISTLSQKFKMTAIYTSASRICQYMYYVSCAVNFFIFLSAWRLFRCKLWEVFRKNPGVEEKNEFIVIELATKKPHERMKLLGCGKTELTLCSSVSFDVNEKYSRLNPTIIFP